MLQTENITSIQLDYAVDSLIEMKFTPSEFDGTVHGQRSNGETFEIKAKFSARGRFRRKTCDFPPLEINFGKKSLKKNGLKKHDKYKLVTHCKEACFENNVLYREYAIYKMYNVLTDRSFRVYPLTITYTDANTDETWTEDGFIIESNDELEERMGLSIQDKYGLVLDSIDAINYETIAVFNYMVGNSDFDVKLMHNCKIFKPDGDKYFLIPYDYDFSKIVLAPYARHSLERTELFTREFHGSPDNQPMLMEVFEQFNDKQDQIHEAYQNIPQLRAKDRSFFRAYVNSFYKMIKRLDKIEYTKAKIPTAFRL